MHAPTRTGRRGVLLALAAATSLIFGRRISAAGEDQAIPQPEDRSDAGFVKRAFELRRAAVDGGDQAYGAVVVRDGRVVGQAPSRVIENRDPTAHAEMEAIRDAARRVGSRDLSGCVLYSSSAPCPMCEAAAYWAGIAKLVHGREAQDRGRPRLCG